MKTRLIMASVVVCLLAGLAWWRLQDVDSKVPQRTSFVSPPSPPLQVERVIFSSDDVRTATANFATLNFRNLTPVPSLVKTLGAVLSAEASRDEAFHKLLLGSHSRGAKIGTLIALLKEAETPEQRAYILDLLATLQPVEAAGELIQILDKTQDDPSRARILGTLRAAAMVTAEPGINLDDPELPDTLAAIQGAFRKNLTPETGDLTKRAAIEAIPAIFPAEEAAALLQSQAEQLQQALDAGQSFAVSEPELFGLWMDTSIGANDYPDLTRQLGEFIAKNPDVALDDATKAKAVAQVSAMIDAGVDPQRFTPVVDAIMPKAVDDSSFANWVDLQALLHGDKAYVTALKSTDVMAAAGVILFSRNDVVPSLSPDQHREIAARLQRAIAASEDDSSRAFLEQAASKLEK